VDRQEAALVVVGVEQGQLLGAVDHVQGVVDVEGDRLGLMGVGESPDAQHVLGLIAPLRALAGAHTWRLGLLALPDQDEEAAEPLVLQHGGLGDAPQPVEGRAGDQDYLSA
jgi:hypothetical protein